MAKPSATVYISRMIVPFRKMEGCGNDFVVLDARQGALPLTPPRAAALADRRRGIGCDQIVVLEPPTGGADIEVRFLNADGGEAGACGNATRCVAALLAAETGQSRFVLGTQSGELRANLLAPGRVSVDMGAPRLDWREIPLSHPRDTLHLDIGHGPASDPAGAGMGNPHATFFVPDIDTIDIEALGPILEHDPLFPDRANIGFAQILASDRIRLRVWERGAGLTLACGSGACAALVNAHRRGLAARAATVLLDGGELLIEWLPDGHVLMTGPASTAFTGTVDLGAWPA